MAPADDERYQKRYFDLAENQYPRSSIVEPPVHTAVEVQRVLERLREMRIETPVVDFGCGTGRLSLPLAAAGYSVVAVDISDGSLDVLHAIARELSLPPVRTESSLPGDEHFSAIVGTDVLHHVDLREHLPRIHASLCDGGKAIFSEPGALNPSWYVYLALYHELRVEKRIVTCNVLTLRRTFERFGFRDVRITGLGLLPRPWFRSSRACRRHDATGNWPLLRWFAYRYLIEATK